MLPAHRALLRAQRLRLSSQLLLVGGSVLHLLYQEEVLTESQVEEIEAQGSSRRSALRLLDLLPTRGPRAFPVLLEALRQDYSWLRAGLLEELGEEPSWLECCSPGGGAGLSAGSAL